MPVGCVTEPCVKLVLSQGNGTKNPGHMHHPAYFWVMHACPKICEIGGISRHRKPNAQIVEKGSVFKTIPAKFNKKGVSKARLKRFKSQSELMPRLISNSLQTHARITTTLRNFQRIFDCGDATMLTAVDTYKTHAPLIFSFLFLKRG